MPQSNAEIIDKPETPQDGGMPAAPADEIRPYSYVRHATDGKVRKYAEFICDNAKDIDMLPTDKSVVAVGSKCLCIENGVTFVLSNHRRWVVPGEYVADEGGNNGVDDNGVDEVDFGGE